jgi:hypothetical protein
MEHTPMSQFPPARFQRVPVGVLPAAVKVGGNIFTVGPVNSPEGEGYLPADLLAARNVASAHLSLARQLLALIAGKAPGEFAGLLRSRREDLADGGAAFTSSETALLAGEITCQNGAEIVSAVFEQLNAARGTAGPVNAAPVCEDNAHAAAYAAALQLAREVLRGAAPSFAAADLDRLQAEVDREAWAAADRRAAGAPTAAESGRKTAERPDAPTPEYCLLPGGLRVRWKGETDLQPRLYRLLDYFLRRKDYPVPVGAVEQALWGNDEKASKTLANMVSALNGALAEVEFPWTWRVSSGHIYRDS